MAHNTIHNNKKNNILARILPSIEKFILHNRAAFRKERSIDVVWTHKMKIASAITSKKTLKIQGIDLSSAFDSVNRETYESYRKHLHTR